MKENGHQSSQLEQVFPLALTMQSLPVQNLGVLVLLVEISAFSH